MCFDQLNSEQKYLRGINLIAATKYCQLVIDEGGIELLVALTQHEAPYHRIKELAAKVISKCQEQEPDNLVFANLPKFLVHQPCN